MMVNAFSDRSSTCRSGNCTLMECVRSFSAPCSLGLNSAKYLENEKAQPLHSTAPNFLVALAPSSSSKKTSKYPLVSKVIVKKGVGRCSFRQSCNSLNEALPTNVLPITVLRALKAAFFCNLITITARKSASISRL